jgi:hypothetical protein
VRENAGTRNRARGTPVQKSEFMMKRPQVRDRKMQLSKGFASR